MLTADERNLAAAFQSWLDDDAPDETDAQWEARQRAALEPVQLDLFADDRAA